MRGAHRDHRDHREARPRAGAGAAHQCRINGTHYKVDSKLLTGAELYTLAGIPTGNQLFLEVPGEDNDRPITADMFDDQMERDA
jgi:hypothetical protein